jgi:hypothetical protein
MTATNHKRKNAALKNTTIPKIGNSNRFILGDNNMTPQREVKPEIPKDNDSNLLRVGDR